MMEFPQCAKFECFMTKGGKAFYCGRLGNSSMWRLSKRCQPSHFDQPVGQKSVYSVEPDFARIENFPL